MTKPTFESNSISLVGAIRATELEAVKPIYAPDIVSFDVGPSASRGQRENANSGKRPSQYSSVRSVLRFVTFSITSAWIWHSGAASIGLGPLKNGSRVAGVRRHETGAGRPLQALGDDARASPSPDPAARMLDVLDHQNAQRPERWGGNNDQHARLRVDGIPIDSIAPAH